MTDERSIDGESNPPAVADGQSTSSDQAQRRETASASVSIEVDAEVLASERFSLIERDQQLIGKVGQLVPGGLQNIQDIYPLAPLQEGILFHHLLSKEVDSYVLSILFHLDSRGGVAALIRALQRVIDRHDILRTAVLWETLETPMQAVLRVAELHVEEFVLDGGITSIEQLKARMRPVFRKRDLAKVPLAWLEVADDPHETQSYAILRVHHLICDHQSLRVVVDEVLACLEGRDDRLPSPVPFRTYVASALEKGRTRDAEAFFRRKLADIVDPTAPFEVSDVHGDGSQIEESQYSLPTALVMQIREQARRCGVSAARLFHAAWALVVARTSGKDDVVFGTVVLAAKQRTARAQRMLGLSVNTLPLRLCLRGVTAEQLLEQTHQELVQLLGHDAASLSLAQMSSGIAGATPLFTSLLNFRHNAPTSDVHEGSGRGVRVLARGEAWTNYPLTMTVDDLGEGFAVMAKADRRIGSQRVIAYLCSALQSLSDALERAPQTPAVLLPVMPEAERRVVIEQFNATTVSRAGTALLHELFEQQVVCAPDAIAVVHESKSLTYGELNGRANQLANYLRARGVGPDQLVAICLERSVEMLVGLLGVLKAGGAYVPIDPTNPRDRLEHVLSDAAPRVLLTREGLRDALPKTAAEVVTLDSEWEKIAKESGERAVCQPMQPDQQNPAYVIYTSGTTGKPKGVVITHRNIVNYATHVARHLNVASGDGSLVCTSLSFDLMLTGLYPTLLSGRKVRLCPDQQGLPQLADEILKCERLSPLKLTPSHLPLLEQALREGQLDGRVQTLVLGGEPLLTRAVKLWKRHSPGTRLVNHYGPTEATVGCLMHEIDGETENAIPLGRPIANTQAYCLDRYGQPVPVGVVGEIYIGGIGVARGYHNRPELTADRFIPNPYAQEPGARMYRTGDLGRWRPDGSIEYLGRNDHQVKIRGFRIELGEIEARLAMGEGIKEAVVVAREDVPGEKRLVAYVAFRDPTTPLNATALRAHVIASLPEYMVPSAFVKMEAMPLTANGKLDRHALPAPKMERNDSAEHESPQGEVEEILAGIWQALLRVDRVGRSDNFFELGGHSILIVQMMARLRNVGLSADARSVFEHPTLADLSGMLTREAMAEFEVPPNLIPAQCEAITPQMLTLVDLNKQQIETVFEAVPGGASNIQDIYPLAPLQEGILFHHLFNERCGDVYVRSIVLAVSSRERTQALIAALQAVIDRHDALRTAILWEQLPQPLQVVCHRATLPVEEIMLDRGRDAPEQILERLRSERQRLDLRQAPLMRLEIASGAADGQIYILLKSHHITSDFTSQEIVTSEVVALMNGRDMALPTPIPYRNHVAQALAYARSRDAEAFFRSKLADVDEPAAPFGLLDVHGDGSQIKESQQEIEPALAESIRTQARRCGVSAATLFHAAWGLVVAHTSGQDDVIFGTVLLGRMQGSAGAQRILGMFINTLPCRLQLRGVTTKELVERTQRELIDLLHFEQASLAVAQRCASLTRSAPLFSALLNYRHTAPDPDAEWSKAEGVRVRASLSRTNYPVVVSIDDLGDGFRVSVQTDFRVDPCRIASYLRTTLQSLVESLRWSPQAPALGLTVLSEEERRKIVTLFNSTHADYPRDRLIHELFEEQVRRTPDGLAVTFCGESLTYAALNQKSNQLAHYLRQKDVKTDVLVGICVERSIEMVVGLLGILKSGGAYIPLDPNYPAERLAYMLNDAQPKVLLVQERLRTRLPVTGATIVALDANWDEIRQCPSVDLVTEGRQVSSHRLAYVIYTSGSTGKPKGVAIEHRNTINLIYWARTALDQDVFRMTVQSTSLNFDLAVYECFVPLCIGGSIVVVENALALLRDPNRVTLINTVPSAIAGILDSGRIPESTRVINLAGEILKEELVDRIFAHSAVDLVCNLYGPSETTTYSTWISMQRRDGFDASIGYPVANTQVYILDQRQKLAPLGVLGEIYIGGAGVARGYLNRPELTAQRFLPDPFGANSQARMYKTGDLGRWRADGTIEYLGRNDHQVKIRGHRIELGEIEAQLARHAQVKDAVVIARDDAQGGKRLVAYVTRRSASDPSVKGLRDYLEALVPEYMMPSAFVILHSLPLTPNGKLDRRALPSPEVGAYAYREYEAPQGKVEMSLAAIWEDLLEVKRVGRQDNFFELGGHSLLALKALFRTNQVFGCNLSVRDIYKSPTLPELAIRIYGEDIEENFVNLAQEAMLDDGIAAKPSTRCNSARIILLTGATGFVGRFLLAELLQNSDATVHCLVRASSQQDGAARLRATMVKWDLWRDEFAQRIVAVSGDLQQPNLGIPERSYWMLAQTVDHIYHCATSMNHLESYAMAKRANVDSARELLKLATAHKPKLINYISTLGVFTPFSADAVRVVNEVSPIDQERHPFSRGYAASKWVGEKMFMTAGERGIPCNIFRLGLVWADTQAGRYDELQREYRIFKSCLLSGYGIRNYTLSMAPTPVDYVARSVVFLGTQHSEGGGVFHISSSKQISDGLFELCNERAGTSLELLPMYDWVQEIAGLHRAGMSLPIVPLIESYFRMDGVKFNELQRRTHFARVRFDCNRTHRELEESGIVAPELTDHLLRLFVESMFARDAEVRSMVHSTSDALPRRSHYLRSEDFGALGG